MRIDPRFFNRFMIVLAVICLVAIGLASFRFIGTQEKRFLERLDISNPSKFFFTAVEGDTLHMTPGRPVILLFWATWSERSLDELYDLFSWHRDHPNYTVIAAYVKDSPEFAMIHNRPDLMNFFMADGTGIYQDLRVPGIPTVIVFGPNLEIITTQIGTGTEPAWRGLASN